MSIAKVDYDWDFVPDKSKLPDPQETHTAEGASHAPIQKVGINEFESMIDVPTKDGRSFTTDGAFSGYVSLRPDVKGINMSRIALLIQEVTERNAQLTIDSLKEAVGVMLDRLESDSAYLKVKFNFMMKQNSLRSKDENGNPLWGWVKYPSVIEVKQTRDKEARVFLTTDFTYSSACPCSYELAKHATSEREVPAISHSQRSIATTTIEIFQDDQYYFEDLINHHRESLKTECQVMVKREDEQAFAEMNGSYPKFVEDATRLVYGELEKDERIKDFLVVCVHEESLHPHNAVGVIYKGVPGGLR